MAQIKRNKLSPEDRDRMVREATLHVTEIQQLSQAAGWKFFLDKWILARKAAAGRAAKDEARSDKGTNMALGELRLIEDIQSFAEKQVRRYSLLAAKLQETGEVPEEGVLQE